MILPAGLPGYEVYNLNEAYNLDDIDIGAGLVLVLPSLQLQLRSHAYYMGTTLISKLHNNTLLKIVQRCHSEWIPFMVIAKSIYPNDYYSIPPPAFRHEKTWPSMVCWKLSIPIAIFTSCVVFVGLHITANRLFGPQPHTTTYVCIWEIQISSVKAILSSLKARILAAVGSSFGHGFIDPLNAPASEFAIPTDPDGKLCPSILGMMY